MSDYYMKHIINQKTYFYLFTYVMILFFVDVNSMAYSQSSTNYIIQADVIDAGGSESSSANYDILYSVGQPSIIGNLSSNNYFVFAGYWNALFAEAPRGIFSISGVGMNTPSSPKWRASLATNVNETNMSSGLVRYYYTRQRMDFIGNEIMGFYVSGNTATIIGIGDATRVNGSDCIDCTFTVTINDSNPDQMGIEILQPDGSNYFKQPPSGGTALIEGGNFNIIEQ